MELREDWKYCPKCKTILEEKNIELSKENMLKKKKKDTIGIIICIVLHLGCLICLFTIGEFWEYFFVGALFSITAAYIEYHNNIIVKILFWLFVIGVIVSIALIVYAMFTCIDFITSCSLG